MRELLEEARRKGVARAAPNLGLFYAQDGRQNHERAHATCPMADRAAILRDYDSCKNVFSQKHDAHSRAPGEHGAQPQEGADVQFDLPDVCEPRQDDFGANATTVSRFMQFRMLALYTAE